jgi:Uma2 family endonuclease
MNQHLPRSLIGGELVPMAAKGNRHERLRLLLTNWMFRRIPGDMDLLPEPGWRPGEDTYAEPGIILSPKHNPPQSVPGQLVYLVVEISDSSLDYDLKIKSALYDRLGVREYRVINARRLVTHVFKQPTRQGCASVTMTPASEMLIPEFAPGAAVRLDDPRRPCIVWVNTPKREPPGIR